MKIVRRPMRVVILIVASLITLSACASVSSVREARGSGSIQIFNYPYDIVYEAAIDAVRDQSIQIVERDKTTGSILGKTTSTGMGTYGERVAVYLYPLDPAHTKVEVISKRVVATTIFAKDWTDSIFLAIHKNLQER